MTEEIRAVSLAMGKALAILGATTGSVVAQGMEQIFPYELRIENKLTVPIAYCEDFEASNCHHVLQSGQSARQVFMSRSQNGSYERKLEAFDRQKIRLCDKLVDFKLIRSVSPLVRIDEDHFQILIDKTVVDKFCQER